ncbi:MAG: hypothetical protein IPL58_15605 [Betaproteobacteria bacterium]|uniref:Uncharacterized protein n=1 Tax=Candidatus Proximibacter danicus TaxID=2954365 RepID=A0A9D7K689_9PROT|nr:hypothetical protein [Candidatus Proximibacter danicus]
MEPTDELANRFFDLGVFLIRNGSHPAFGIATAQALLDAEPTMSACLSTAFSILVPAYAFCNSVLRDQHAAVYDESVASVLVHYLK